MHKLALILVVAAACGDATPEHDGDDHSPERLVLEGTEIVDLLGDDLVSDPQTSEGGFRRLGLLWDATDEGTLELRTSTDGVTWSAWAAPVVVSVEMIAHAGHLDAAGDDVAYRYQLRIAEGKTMPTFLVVEPITEIPVVIDPDELEIENPETAQEITELALATPIGAITIHTRAEWGARPPRCAMSSMTPNRATIHHTVTPTNDSMTVPARLRQIQSFHQNSRGWCDIGYNFLVSRDGRVWTGRGALKVGAHVENSNTGNVGVSFIGTYTTTAPTSTQMCQTAKLLRRLSGSYSALDLNRTDVKGHRQLGSTACPGNALYTRIDAILRKARGGCAVN